MIERLRHGASVDIWRVDLMDDWDRFAVLSADEEARALRYAVEPPAQQFRRCRIALRMLLARYLHCEPSDVIFRYTPMGKPELARAPGESSLLHFNVSHCQHRALVAIAAEPVGIDLEFVRHDGVAVSDLIDLVCHPDEKRTLERLPAEQRPPHFYRLWTRKEAYCKARGTGLQLSLPSIQFLSRPPGCPRAVHDAFGGAAAQWWIFDLDDAEECVGTLCCQSPRAHIRERTVTPGTLAHKWSSSTDDAIANQLLYELT